jgi:hypothetical protein
MASEPAAEGLPKFSLPTAVVTPSDLGRLVRELEHIEDKLQNLKVRGPEDTIELPAVTHQMEKLLTPNKLNLLHPGDRHALRVFLTSVKKDAPVMHISFSSEPSPIFLERLLSWIRREINPLVLLTVGLQPAIGAGCIVRTTNKYFDLSLRQTFIAKRQLLLEQIIPPVPVPAAATVQPVEAAPA